MVTTAFSSSLVCSPEWDFSPTSSFQRQRGGPSKTSRKTSTGSLWGRGAHYLLWKAALPSGAMAFSPSYDHSPASPAKTDFGAQTKCRASTRKTTRVREERGGEDAPDGIKAARGEGLVRFPPSIGAGKLRFFLRHDRHNSGSHEASGV